MGKLGLIVGWIDSIVWSSPFIRCKPTSAQLNLSGRRYGLQYVNSSVPLITSPRTFHAWRNRPTHQISLVPKFLSNQATESPCSGLTRSLWVTPLSPVTSSPQTWLRAGYGRVNGNVGRWVNCYWDWRFDCDHCEHRRCVSPWSQLECWIIIPLILSVLWISVSWYAMDYYFPKAVYWNPSIYAIVFHTKWFFSHEKFTEMQPIKSQHFPICATNFFKNRDFCTRIHVKFTLNSHIRKFSGDNGGEHGGKIAVWSFLRILDLREVSQERIDRVNGCIILSHSSLNFWFILIMSSGWY